MFNVLPPDTAGVAPTVSLSTPDDADPIAAGVQGVAGSSFLFQADVADDGPLARVDLLVDGRLIASDAAARWAIWVTSLWSRMAPARPAARLDTMATAAVRRPSPEAASTSGTVDMPTMSAPRARSMRISAGVS